MSVSSSGLAFPALVALVMVSEARAWLATWMMPALVARLTVSEARAASMTCFRPKLVYSNNTLLIALGNYGELNIDAV